MRIPFLAMPAERRRYL